MSWDRLGEQWPGWRGPNCCGLDQWYSYHGLGLSGGRNKQAWITGEQLEVKGSKSHSPGGHLILPIVGLERENWEPEVNQGKIGEGIGGGLGD